MFKSKFAKKITSIRAILILSFSLVAFIPSVIFGIYEWTHWLHASYESDEKLSDSAAKTIAQEVKNHIDSIYSDLQIMSKIIDSTKPSSATQKLLDLYRNKLQLGAIFIIDTSGFSVAASPITKSNGNSSVGIDYRDRDYVQYVLSQGKEFISPIRFSRITGKASFQIAVPLWNKTKTKVVGLIGSSVTSSEVYSNAKRSVKDIQSLNLIITDGQYHVITQTNNIDPSIIEDYSDFHLIHQQEHVGIKTLSKQGQNIFGTALSLPMLNSHWHIAVFRPMTVVETHAKRFIKSVLTFSFIMLLIAIGTGIVLSQLIAKPIISIVQAIQLLPNREYRIINAENRKHSFFHELSDTWTALDRTAKDLEENTSLLEEKVNEKIAELEKQRAMSIHNSKLAALGEMAAGVAHEINNPLTIICMKTQILLEGLESKTIDQTQLSTGLQKIYATSERIAKIVSGLRSASRSGETDPFEICNVQTIINETLAICQERLRMNEIELKLEIDESLNLSCRNTQISQVLLNLLNNSIDAIQKQEVKWIQVKAEKLSSEITRISVVDSGLGIPENIREKIMQPFFTTKPVGKGTGLGLSISRNIVQQHDGLFYYDPLSPNTRFVIELPVAKAQAKKVA